MTACDPTQTGLCKFGWVWSSLIHVTNCPSELWCAFFSFIFMRFAVQYFCDFGALWTHLTRGSRPAKYGMKEHLSMTELDIFATLEPSELTWLVAATLQNTAWKNTRVWQSLCKHMSQNNKSNPQANPSTDTKSKYHGHGSPKRLTDRTSELQPGGSPKSEPNRRQKAPEWGSGALQKPTLKAFVIPHISCSFRFKQVEVSLSSQVT